MSDRVDLKDRARALLARMKASPPAHWLELLVAVLRVVQADERSRCVEVLRCQGYVCRHLRKEGCDLCAAAYIQRNPKSSSAASSAQILDTVVTVLEASDSSEMASAVLDEIQALLQKKKTD